MRKHIGSLVVIVLLSSLATALFPIVYSSEFIDYNSENNVCVVYPSGDDDTSNLQEAFDTVVAGGLGGEVQLLEGVYTISAPIIVVNFDGWFHGEGKEKTLVENEYTESWPLPDFEDLPTDSLKKGSPRVFLFYQTDDVPRTLRFSDMSIKIHGQSVEDPDFMNATGIIIFKIHGKVDGDSENLYESEINTIFERMHFEGEAIDSWIVHNVMGCIFVSGEPIPSIEFKPLSGTHIIDNCTFYNSGGCIRYDTMTGHIVVTNNDFRNISFFSILPRNPNMPHLGTYFVYNNKFHNGMIMDTIIFVGIDNSVIKNNILSGSSSGGITFSGSNHNHIQGNNITGCTFSGIKLEKSDDNIILDNYVKTNGTDLVWDGYGENLWMRNVFDTVNNTDIIDPNEAAVRNLEDLLEEMDAEKESLQDELEYTTTVLSGLENDLEEATTSISNLEDQLTSANSEVMLLQGQVESLEGEVAHRLTYITLGIIAVVVAVVFGAIGFLMAKRT